MVLTCCEGAPRLGIIYGRHRLLDSRGSALHLCRLQTWLCCKADSVTAAQEGRCSQSGLCADTARKSKPSSHFNCRKAFYWELGASSSRSSVQLGVNLSGSQALENTGCQSAAQQESQLERPWTTEAPTLVMIPTPPTVPGTGNEGKRQLCRSVALWRLLHNPTAAASLFGKSCKLKYYLESKPEEM